MSFAVDSARDPERAARIAKSSAMTGMPARLLSRVTPLVTPFERVAEDQATHLRLLSRDARRRDAERGDGEGAGKGERWIMDANDALTAWAAASALEEASAASEARLTRALAEASEEQLRALEAAARARAARRPPTAVKNDAVKNDAAEISTETSVRSEKENTRVPSSAVAIPPETSTDVSASEQKRTPKPTSVSETVSEAPPFSVDAALARFDPTRARASAPIREDAFLSAAESAAAEAARLGPSARELYYASYKAAMQEATASLNRSDASAVLAAAAGAGAIRPRSFFRGSFGGSLSLAR